MTVGKLCQTMSFAEFSEWLILLGIEPWGPYRGDCLVALQRHAALAPWSKEPIKMQDLVPHWGGAPSPKSRWEEKAAKLRDRAIAAVESKGD